MKIRSILTLALFTNHINCFKSFVKEATLNILPQIERTPLFFIPSMLVGRRSELVNHSILIQIEPNKNLGIPGINFCIYNIFNFIIMKNFAILMYMQYYEVIWNFMIKRSLDLFIPSAWNPNIWIMKIIILAVLEWAITIEYNYQDIENKYMQKNLRRPIPIKMQRNNLSNILMFYTLKNTRLASLTDVAVKLQLFWEIASSCATRLNYRPRQHEPDYLISRDVRLFSGIINITMFAVIEVAGGLIGIKDYNEIIFSMTVSYMTLICSFYLCMEYVPDYSEKIPEVSADEAHKQSDDIKLIISEYNKRSLEKYLADILAASDTASLGKNKVFPGLLIGSQENKTGKSTALDKMILDIIANKKEDCELYAIPLSVFARSVDNLSKADKINKIKDLLVEFAILKQEELKYEKRIIFILKIDEFDKYPQLILFAAKIFHDMQAELNFKCSLKEKDGDNYYPGCIFTLFATTNDLFSVLSLFGADIFASRRMGSVILDREVETEYKPYYENFKKAENLKILDFGNITEKMVKDKIKNMIDSLNTELDIKIKQDDQNYNRSEEILSYHARNLCGKAMLSELLGRINYNLMCELEDRFTLSKEEKQSIQGQGTPQEKEDKFLEIIDSKLSGIFQNLQNKMLQGHDISLTTTQAGFRRMQLEGSNLNKILMDTNSKCERLKSRFQYSQNGNYYTQAAAELENLIKKLQDNTNRSACATTAYFAETLPIEPRKCAGPELVALALTKSLFGYSPMQTVLTTILPSECSLSSALIARTTDLGQFTDENGEKQYYTHETYISFVCALCDAMFKTNLLESCNSIKYFKEVLTEKEREIYSMTRDDSKEILEAVAANFQSSLAEEYIKDIKDIYEIYKHAIKFPPEDRSYQATYMMSRKRASETTQQVVIKLMGNVEIIEIKHLKNDVGQALKECFSFVCSGRAQLINRITDVLSEMKQHGSYQQDHVDAITELRYPIRTTLKKLEKTLSVYKIEQKLVDQQKISDQYEEDIKTKESYKSQLEAEIEQLKNAENEFIALKTSKAQLEAANLICSGIHSVKLFDRESAEQSATRIAIATTRILDPNPA